MARAATVAVAWRFVSKNPWRRRWLVVSKTFDTRLRDPPRHVLDTFVHETARERCAPRSRAPSRPGQTLRLASALRHASQVSQQE